jgi:hypothetical protein
MKRGIIPAIIALLGAGGIYAAARDGGEPARTPYARWKHGPPADPGYFPIAVWLQSPAKDS